MKDLKIEFPLDKFENLITQMGWKTLDEWFDFWDTKKEILSIDNYWDDSVNEDWIWGLAYHFYLKHITLIRIFLKEN